MSVIYNTRYIVNNKRDKTMNTITFNELINILNTSTDITRETHMEGSFQAVYEGSDPMDLIVTHINGMATNAHGTEVITLSLRHNDDTIIISYAEDYQYHIDNETVIANAQGFNPLAITIEGVRVVYEDGQDIKITNSEIKEIISSNDLFDIDYSFLFYK